MDPLSVTASIIAIFQLTVKVGERLHDAKDASTERSQFTTETSNLSSLLLTLLSHIDESSNEPWHTKVRELGGKDGLVYQYRVALEQLKDKILGGHGLKKIAKTLLWKYIKEDAESILLRIERLKSLVQIALQMDHFNLSQAIESRMTSMQNDNKAIKIGVDAMQQDQDRQRHHLIMDWLSSADFSAQQSDFIARRQEETGFWFLESPEFTDWVSGTSQTLFCHGIPGAGKTMMTAIAVDHLQKTVQTADIGVAYMYCNYKRQADQTTSSLLAAMLKQLVQDRPSIAKPLWSLYDHHEVRRTRPSVEEMLGALQSVLVDYSRIYVVIDALDECVHDDRRELLSKLRNLQSKTGLRLMATSRFIPDIVEEFNGLPKLEVRADDADVKRYVAGQIKRLPGCVRRDDALQKLVQNKIVQAVDGMFLLARLHVDLLLDKDTKKKVKSTLEHLSGGTEALKKAYDGAIERIDGQLPGKTARAKSVLSWISYAARPLTTGELCHALAVELDEEELDEDNIPDIEEIVSVCAGLVTVDEESNVIRLVHYTTQDYLKGIREKWNPSAQHDIASTCIAYLCFKTFRSGSCASDAEFETRLEENIFLNYSARYWVEHAGIVQEEVYGLAMRLLQDKNLVACAVQTKSMPGYKYPRYSQDFRKQMTGLHLAASSGLLHLCEGLLSWTVKEKVLPVDSKDSNGQTPLSLAAARGHEAVVKVLVKREDVKADSKDNNGRTPLWWAAGGGHEAVVKVLVERDDVEADLKDNNSHTPLLWAAFRGHEAIVKMLVEREDVKADLKDSNSRTLLLLAAERGYEAVVKVLVEQNDVEADLKDYRGRTLLWWAAARGYEAVVKVLVEQDDVEADLKDYRG
ncbi:hypothetical protein HBH70_194640 [Parastagonospora nodorum]|nr:hypothetical protein HBI06_211630 [Parastagonospora nodorum]KAH4229873.1 hypothetical protein HBI05_192030 [Parastagonospora nodorum]KAH4806182.1 hypothetical protein HBH61_149810 [Parastagonospora nodorum]KAH4982052.1 hypothetical protein HBI76_161490 [Parastagonospora nodorum]KAH5088632.1 hypothetical protein HBI73_132210 [Parastagonospora nodorum]